MAEGTTSGSYYRYRGHRRMFERNLEAAYVVQSFIARASDRLTMVTCRTIFACSSVFLGFGPKA